MAKRVRSEAELAGDREYSRTYRRRNPISEIAREKNRVYMREWRARNIEKDRERKRLWRRRHATEIAPKRKAIYEEREKDNCPDCGRPKSARAERCQECAQGARTQAAEIQPFDPKYPNRQYMREWMRKHRKASLADLSVAAQTRKLDALRKRPIEIKQCRLRGCASQGQPHHHCECGLPLHPHESACLVCISEQRRLEFKRLSRAA